MKNLKLILLGLASLVLISTTSSKVHAQGKRNTFALTAVKQDGTQKATADTTANTDTTYLVLSDGADGIKPYDLYNDIVYYWSITPGITGTTTGQIVLQGSMTGTFSRSSDPVSGWTTLTPVTTYSTADSTSFNSALAAAGGFGSTTANHRFIVTNNQYRYHRIRFISGGTQTSYLAGRVSVLSH